MKFLRVVSTLFLGLWLATPLLAGGTDKADKTAKAGKAKKAGKSAPDATLKRLDVIAKKATLTADQTAKIDGLKKEYEPKLADAKKQIEAAQQLVEAAKKQAEEAKLKMKAAKTQAADASKGLVDKAMDVLTAEQKEQLKPKKGAGKKGAKQEPAVAAPAVTK